MSRSAGRAEGLRGIWIDPAGWVGDVRHLSSQVVGIRRQQCECGDASGKGILTRGRREAEVGHFYQLPYHDEPGKIRV